MGLIVKISNSCPIPTQLQRVWTPVQARGAVLQWRRQRGEEDVGGDCAAPAARPDAVHALGGSFAPTVP